MDFDGITAKRIVLGMAGFSACGDVSTLGTYLHSRNACMDFVLGTSRGAAKNMAGVWDL